MMDRMYADRGSAPSLATVKRKAEVQKQRELKMRCLLLLEFLWGETG